ncbi:putative ABC transport system permease protein [Lentzea albidocapillata subsp. violacea]|uniref:Putative ABC transport system permease protein n=1 Tax=Lentzea albidocapillata subsp. violacea TaxID=128104 RepID=A0A1G8Z2S1_9PSEU|nr:ABC transporter permease [Lentzea albidocapillata]SDK09336.1 putative ABC transport system permease protein [Lentzea albidocapillata subsp. violacea]
MQLPWRAAPRAALSSPLTLVVSIATTLLLGFVVAAAALHSSAAGSAALAYQQSRMCPHSVHPSLDGDGLPLSTAVSLAARSDLGGAYSRIGRPDFNGIATYGRFGYRPDALSHLTVVQGGGTGLWVPQTIATAAQVQIGDRLTGSSLVVSAIYADLAQPVDGWWCSEAKTVVPNPLAGDGASTSVIWVASANDLSALPPEFESNATVSLRFPAEAPATLAEAEALRDNGNARMAALGLPLTRTDLLSGAVVAARTSERNVSSALLPLVLISVLVGLAGVGTVTVQWAQRRHSELRLLWVRGASPLALGFRGVLELGLPLVLGGALGLVAARLLLPLYAPGVVLAPGTLWVALGFVLAVVVLSLAVTVLVASWRAHRTFQRQAHSRRLALVPWELVVAGLAVLAWVRLSQNGLGTSLKPGSLPRVDVAALAFPLLVVLAAALLATRLLRWSLEWSHHVQWWQVPAAQLALRRLAAAVGPVTGVLLVGVLAVGTIAVGSAVAGAQQSALDSKSGVFVGANSTVQVSQDIALGRVALPSSLRGNTTLVGVSTGALIVDPATFTDAAVLNDATEVRSLLSGLKRTGEVAPALRIGRSANQEIQIAGLPLLKPVAALPSFPKLGTRGYVVARDSVPAAEQVGSWHLWSTLPLSALTSALQADGIHYTNVADRARVLDGLPFLTVEWTFGFVAAIGVVLAVVAAVALLLAIEVRRRQNAVSGALSTRMGMRPSVLWSSHLLEVGALALLAMGIGVVASFVSAGAAVPRLDPAPWLNPAPMLPDLLPLLGSILTCGALVVVVAAWLALRGVRTARMGELLR